MIHTLLTATLIISIESITAFSGDLKYVQMPDGYITGMAGRVVETASMNPNIAIEVGRELIPGMYNITVSNGGMISSSRLIKR